MRIVKGTSKIAKHDSKRLVPHTHNKTWSQAVTRDGVCEYLPWTPPARCKVTARALMVIACRVRR